MDLTLTAILLGILEGLTEFIPVSSTGHLILATELFGYDAEEWRVFNVVIQLGAVMAVVVQYWRTFWAAGMGMTRFDPMSIAFVRNLIAGFLPAAVLGFLFKGQINDLLGNPLVVAYALVAGGIAIVLIERNVRPSGPSGIAQIPVRQALTVGFFQCLAMVPGVSRSGATIMGALLIGIERRTAAEFSFFLAVPTMLGATVLQIMEHREELASGAGVVGWGEIAAGFVAAFMVALVVIRAFVAFVSRTGFTPFGYYRIGLGLFAIAVLTWF
jgi:undecaprenyl-diphosphatase